MFLGKEKILNNLVLPIGIIFGLVISLIFTFNSPLGMFLLDPIACPQDDCNVSMVTETYWTYNRRGNDSSVFCKCAGGGVVDIPVWLYIIHFLLAFGFVYIPIVFVRATFMGITSIRKKRRRGRKPDSRRDKDEINGSRIIIVLASVILIVAFLIYILT